MGVFFAVSVGLICIFVLFELAGAAGFFIGLFLLLVFVGVALARRGLNRSLASLQSALLKSIEQNKPPEK